MAYAQDLGVMSAIIDLSTDTSTTVCDSPCVLLGFYLSVTVGTGAATIDDSKTAKINLPVSLPVGSYNTFGALFSTSLVVNPADNSTGTLVVFYRKI